MIHGVVVVPAGGPGKSTAISGSVNNLTHTANTQNAGHTTHEHTSPGAGWKAEVMLALIATAATAALLGDMAIIRSPVEPATVAQLYNGKETQAPAALAKQWHWAALLPTASPTVGADFDTALVTAPASIRAVLGVPDALPEAGSPMAVGRLRCKATPPMIDCLRCALPKEDPAHSVQLGLVIDALLLEWAEHVRASGAAANFNALVAAGSITSNEALEARGFLKSDDVVDLRRLGAGEAVASHAVQLTLAVEKAQQRAAEASVQQAAQDSSPYDLLHAETIATTLCGLEGQVRQMSDVRTLTAASDPPHTTPRRC